MATEQPVPERLTPDWHVEPRPCPCCDVGSGGLTDCERLRNLARFHAGFTPEFLADPLRWDGDDT